MADNNSGLFTWAVLISAIIFCSLFFYFEYVLPSEFRIPPKVKIDCAKRLADVKIEIKDGESLYNICLHSNGY